MIEMDFSLIAQTASENLSKEADMFSNLAPPIQVAVLLGALSFATAMLVSVTAFTRIVIVLSFVRRALSTQEIPPNQVMLGLSMFLTMFVMAPTFERIHERAIVPLLEAEASDTEASTVGENPFEDTSEGLADKTEDPIAAMLFAQGLKNSPTTTNVRKGAFRFIDAWNIASTELKVFMLHNTRTDDLGLFYELSETPVPSDRMDTPLKIAIPAFIISELKTAFIMGFCIYIPFLLIDLVVSTILMALGMMMMPPVVVSTPCKLLLFILVDGWQLISRALVASFV